MLATTSTPSDQGSQEQWALTLSIMGSAVFAVLGGVFGLYTHSGAILLDGFYSLMTMTMSFVSLKVAALIQEGPSRRYQFGYYGFEPFINTIKGIIVLSVSLFAFVSAIEDLLHGGRDLVVGLALAYATLSTVGCFTFAILMHRYAQRLNLPLLEVEARDWTVDGCISSAVALTFVVTLLLQDTSWNIYLSYVDPLLVAILVLVIIPLPLRTVFEGVNQLLGVAPESELDREIRKTISQVARIQKHPIDRFHLQMMVQGRVLYVFIQILVPAEFVVDRVQELDQLRQKFADAIADLHPFPEVDIVFTEDPYWLKDGQ
ncbi:cation diffusion facilitator family transporter [Acaryochloris sp. CCMEE 5410]|uniref:cation diffusion facilitator family transporter n=1 Tax=Acaryochloris sp. CCMEE 5410 TaxID=310037 RepID=UPI0002E08F63|nr:cation transporter [Acaryochloris sp. CCMEE 5410]KAI9130683.1 cation transporter [Acaryochloris sp. CCMEE 5410]